MEWWHVYLFTRLDSLHLFVGMLYVICIVVTIGAGINWFVNNGIDDDMATKSKGVMFRIGTVGLIVFAIGVFIPTQKEVAAIYLLPKLAHSDFAKEAQRLPTDAANLMRLKLESWISDMEPKKAEKK